MNDRSQDIDRLTRRIRDLGTQMRHAPTKEAWAEISRERDDVVRQRDELRYRIEKGAQDAFKKPQ